MKNRTENIMSPALGCKVGRAYQCMLSELTAALKDAGLDITSNEYLILRALYSSDGIQQCDIADMTGKDKATVCRSVAELEKKRFVTTQSVSHKCLRVYLTEKARDIEPDILRVANIRHKALADLTTPENLLIFNEILDKIIQSK